MVGCDLNRGRIPCPSTALSRWSTETGVEGLSAFDGLHQLMGCGAISNDNEQEGRRLAQYARSGMTLREAWFRTAKEIQPSNNGQSAPNGPVVWVGVMWASKPGVDPANDHAWSHGSVSGDPTGPTSFTCMRTVC